MFKINQQEGGNPSCLTPKKSPLKGDIPHKYPLDTVYMGLIIKDTIPRVPPLNRYTSMTVVEKNPSSRSEQPQQSPANDMNHEILVGSGSGILICAMVKSRYIGDGHPTFNRNPYNGYINPYYWVDDHPLLYGTIGSLDPSTYWLITMRLRRTHSSHCFRFSVIVPDFLSWLY